MEKATEANEFARAIEEMAGDPEIAKSSEEINAEFLDPEMDGLQKALGLQ